MGRFVRMPTTFFGQVALCTLISSVLILPHLWVTGLNGVTRTYLIAASRFWAGTSPYAPPIPHADWFKYSPSFAMLYGLFLLLPMKAHVLGWAVLNLSVFWMGVARWTPAFRSPVLWPWLIAVSMELDGSIRYQQVNALLTGLTLWAVAEYRYERTARAGTVISAITNFKLFSAPIGLGLATDFKLDFWVASAITGLFLFLLPATHVGWNANLVLHQQWYALISQDAHASGLLDLQSVLGVWFPHQAPWVRHAVGLITLGILVDPRGRPLLTKAGGLWLCAALTGILLYNPRTESPTFVLAAPVLPILWIETSRLLGLERGLVRTGILVAFFFLSLVHNDLWPRSILEMVAWHGADKTLAVLLLWVLTLYTGIRKGQM